jgi:outer membrane protein assembly factor BamA
MIATVCTRVARTIILVVCICAGGADASGQEQALAPAAQTDADSGNGSAVSIIPFPFVYYTPETKVGFGGTVQTLFRLSHDRGQEHSSLLSPIFLYTQKKQIVAIVETELHFGAGRYRMIADVGYSKFPNTIWGIGNDTPDDLEEDYTPRSTYAHVEFQRRVASGWYFGGRLGFAHRKLVEVDSVGLLARGLVPGTDDGRILSGGLLVTWDTRDNVVNPNSGGFRQLSAAIVDSALGSDYDYSSYAIDVRQYVSLAPGQVVALRVLGIASVGTQPFDVMPQLGGEELLRGYYGGRYRDRNLLAVQAEYRAHVWRRFGAIGFVSAGRVAHNLSELGFTGIKPSGGFGLRFLLAPEEGLNLRADWGFGNGSSGFYLGLGEVF